LLWKEIEYAPHTVGAGDLIKPLGVKSEELSLLYFIQLFPFVNSAIIILLVKNA